MRKYMYVHFDGGDAQQSDRPPTAEDIQAVIDGLLEIYRFENSEFQKLTPIDAEDADNWSTVEHVV